MEGNITCSLCAVYEHDMDVLLMQAMLSDAGFLALFLDKTDWRDMQLTAVHAELSNTETDLGETDITVILSDGEKKYALLIEDKIDAVAQPEQHQRYLKRGDKAVKDGAFADYRVFIVCPQKYYDTDKEAAKYEHFVSYEECAAYFQQGTDSMSPIRYQEVMQAIDKAKRPPQVTIKEEANLFFRKYREYQREHFPHLNMRTKETANGYWPDYRTCYPYEKVILYHKMSEGEVDLTFAGGKDKLPVLEAACGWFNRNGLTDICALVTGKSVALRINVPKISYHYGFENIPPEDLDKCFTALSRMVELAKFLQDVQEFFAAENS